MSQQTAPNQQDRQCPYCGSREPLVWVHGHGQCAQCGINIQECCQGETCEPQIFRSNGSQSG